MPPAVPAASSHLRETPSHDHEHSHEHEHARREGHRHPHVHSHGPSHRHPAAKPAPSLLRLSAWQRLGLVLPLAALLWAGTLWVIFGGAS